jgi:hypothetical protein
MRLFGNLKREFGVPDRYQFEGRPGRERPSFLPLPAGTRARPLSNVAQAALTHVVVVRLRCACRKEFATMPACCFGRKDKCSQRCPGQESSGSSPFRLEPERLFRGVQSLRARLPS